MPFVLDVHLHEGGRHLTSSKQFSMDETSLSTMRRGERGVLLSVLLKLLGGGKDALGCQSNPPPPL